MKKLLLLIPIALLVTACGGTSASEPVVDSVSNEDTYLLVVRMDGGPIAEDATDGELLKLGYAACEAFASGATTGDLIAGASARGLTDDARTFLASQVAASKVFLCND